jgi:hypothetical protein
MQKVVGSLLGKYISYTKPVSRLTTTSWINKLGAAAKVTANPNSRIANLICFMYLVKMKESKQKGDMIYFVIYLHKGGLLEKTKKGVDFFS